MPKWLILKSKTLWVFLLNAYAENLVESMGKTCQRKIRNESNFIKYLNYAQ